MTIDDFIIEAFCIIDDEYKKITEFSVLRQRGFNPKLKDSEVITMEIVSKYCAFKKDELIWKSFKNNKKYLFPRIGSSAFVEQSANSWHIKQLIQ